MSRSIKFRAWDKEFRKMWWGGFYLSFNPLGIWAETEDGPEEVSLKYFEIMQYTGLRDRNGVEIYEGDLMEYWGFSGDKKETVSYHDKRPFIFSVEFDKEKARFCERLIYQDKPAQLDGSFMKKSEIIGNIHQPPR